ncbi:MAG: hypothetical protein RJQ09_16385 [Cyclobacteriaceae bacterium]
MAKDVYIYLKYQTGQLQFCNTESGQYQPVEPDTVTAKPWKNDKVIWQCSQDSGIAAITQIGEATKAGNKNIFSQVPSKDNDTCWSGKIKNNVQKGEQEKYDIVFTDSNGVTHTIDPVVDPSPDDDKID